jgi:soluble lytic murein transglycosylase-like protein
MLDDKHNTLAGNLKGSGGNPAAAQAMLRRPGTPGPVRPQLLGQGVARNSGKDFEDMMAAGESQNRIIADVLDGPVSNQTQRQLAQLRAMNGRNPALENFEKGAREAASSGTGNIVSTVRDRSKLPVESRAGSYAGAPGTPGGAATAVTGDSEAAAAPAGNSRMSWKSEAVGAAADATVSGDSGATPGSGTASSGAGNAPAAEVSGTDAAAVDAAPFRRGAISLSAGPTILKGQGTGSIFNAARMAAYHQRYGPQLRMPLRARPDPISLGAAERLSGPTAPPKSVARTSNVPPTPRLKGSIPAVAAELAKSERVKGKPTPEIEATIRRAADALGLDPALVKAVVKAESNFNPKAVSDAGAKGLMQLMPGTAREMGVDDPFNPLENIWGGARYLKRMLDRSGGNLRKALASYNWGPGNIDRFGTGNLPRETRRYIDAVTTNYKHYKSQAQIEA